MNIWHISQYQYCHCDTKLLEIVGRGEGENTIFQLLKTISLVEVVAVELLVFGEEE